MSTVASARRLAGVVAVILFVAGCSALGEGSVTSIGEGPYTEGSGKVATESRSVNAFHAVSASQGVIVFLKSGSAASVAVTADDNLLPHVTTELRNGTLVVGVEGSIRTHNDLKVNITAPSLDEIGASSGATIDGENLTGSLTVRANSGATVRGGGSVDALDLSADAGATADLRNAEARAATVHVSAGSTAYVNAKESVGGSCLVGSTLHVKGAASVDVSKDTSSTIKRD